MSEEHILYEGDKHWVIKPKLIGTCEKLQKIFALVEDYSNGQPRSSRTGAAKEMCEKILELKDKEDER